MRYYCSPVQQIFTDRSGTVRYLVDTSSITGGNVRHAWIKTDYTVRREPEDGLKQARYTVDRWAFHCSDKTWMVTTGVWYFYDGTNRSWRDDSAAMRPLDPYPGVLPNDLLHFVCEWKPK
jgi:hypothetical protein